MTYCIVELKLLVANDDSQNGLTVIFTSVVANDKSPEVQYYNNEMSLLFLLLIIQTVLLIMSLKGCSRTSLGDKQISARVIFENDIKNPRGVGAFSCSCLIRKTIFLYVR